MRCLWVRYFDKRRRRDLCLSEVDKKGMNWPQLIETQRIIGDVIGQMKDGILNVENIMEK